MSALTTFSRVVNEATSLLGESGFAAALGNGIRELIEADDVSLIRYPDAGPPLIEYNLPPKRRGKTTLDRYVKGPFLLDPFYRAAQVEERFGVFRLQALAPIGFKDSEYFRTWYHECGFQDECGLLIKLDRGALNLALGMTDSSRRFSKRQVDRLKAVFPAVEALARRHWSQLTPNVESSNLRMRLQESLSAFGSSMLTRREQQVIELVLLGNSTRLVAEKLGISAETVKLHRKHAYAKLDISSQAELFYLFVDALASHTGESGADPLTSYHRQSTRA
jgi:DNA-binding CsgD family transcriptional regulator